MTITDLAKELSKMYENANKGETATMVHLFGIRYSKYIQENKIPINDILNSTRLKNGSSIPSGFDTEIRKGVKLAKYVVERNAI
jgi:hypothetical protein